MRIKHTQLSRSCMATKTIYLAEYERFISYLKESRELRGLSQGELAMLLGKDQTYVSKYEKCIRRLDLIETIDICDALEISSVEVINKIRKK